MPDDRIRIVVEPDTSGFQGELNQDLSRVNSSFDVNVHADTTAASVQIQKWETKETADPVTKPVEVDTTRARRMLQTFSSAAESPLRKVVNVDTVGAQKALKGLGSVGSKALGSIGTAAKSSGIGALLLLGTAAISGKEELLDMNRVSTQTAGILKNAGLQAKFNTKQIEDLSGALLAKSGIDDQAIQSGTNLLLSQEAFQKTLQKQPELLKKSAEALTGLASTPFFKGNAEAAAKGFGKALADPIKGITALKKAGILFTDAEKDKIKTLVESGKTAEAQALIIEKVQKRTAGLAEARGKSVEGMMGKLSEAVAGAGAGILSKLLPILVKLGSVVQKAFADDGIVTRFINAFKPLGRVFAVIASSFSMAFAGVGEGTDIIGGLSKAMESLAVWFETNQDSVTAFALIIKDMVVAVGGLAKALGPVVLPILKAFAVEVALLVMGLAKVITWVAQAITKFLGWKYALEAVFFIVAGFPGLIILGLVKLVAVIVARWDEIIAYLQAIPGRVMGALRSLGTLVVNFFRAVFTRAVTIAKTILNLYIAYLKAVPLRMVQALIALGGLLWNLASNAFNRFKTAAVTILTNVILFVRGIPGRIVAQFASFGTLLYDKGKAVFDGLFDGMKHVWEKIKGWLSGIGKKIKSLKGPIEVDRVLLVDEGKAIMEGFHEGLKHKWGSVEGWLGKRGGFISGLLSNVGLGRVEGDIGKLLAGETTVQHVLDTIDKESASGLHPSSGLNDTMQQAAILHQILGIVATTFKEGHSKFVAGTNRISQHFLGLAADFGDATKGNDHANLDKAAKWMSRLVGKVFTQIIWRNSFWTGGKRGPAGAIGGHLDHLHAGWIPRRKGGGVSPSQNYMVGEDGIEAFIPNSSGFILNNTRLDRMLNVDRRLGTLERSGRTGGGTGTVVHQTNNITMPQIQAADGAGWAMMTTNRLLEMLRANAVSMVGGVA